MAMHHPDNTLRISQSPAGNFPFEGIGVEADCDIFDDTNRGNGVDEKDLALIERRLRSLNPALARLFVNVAWVNPSLDGTTLDWTLPGYARLVRQLRLLDSMGTKLNLVLFQPHPPHIADPAPTVRAMVALLERLHAVEGIRGLAWLTLYNEPDGMFPHDSPLVRRLFGEQRLTTHPPFSDYVRLNHLALSLLRERNLNGIRLLVADTVWGHPMRVERLRLCREAFAAEPEVDFSYHNYNSEDPGFYVGNPDWAYPGMGAEADMFGGIVGADRRLMLWEFNAAGTGFGSHFPGVGPAGTDLLGAVETGPLIAGKVMQAVNAGVAGICLWCLHDMIYLANPKIGQMQFGLWRYKWQRWYPRPYYHYYALLCRAFRPGCTVLRIEGSAPGVVALAAHRNGHGIAAFLNSNPEPVRISVQGPWQAGLHRLGVHPGVIPVEGDLPVAQASDDLRAVQGSLEIDLAGHELAIVSDDPL